MEKKYIKGFIFICISCLTFGLSAQQQVQLTQFMHNKLRLNPGFAGSPTEVLLQGTHRSQWIGFDGAPTLQMLNLNIPFAEKNVGLGMNLMRFSHGISEAITLDLSYAYTIPVGEGKLGLGLSGSIRNLAMDFSDPALVSTIPIPIDPAIQNGKLTKWLFNVGLGLYYTDDQFYIGFSSPRIFKNSLDFDEDNLVVARESHHYYFMMGYEYQFNDYVKISPQILAKYAPDSPMDLDLNVNTTFF